MHLSRIVGYAANAIRVNRLAWQTSRKELEQHFNKYGKIRRSFIIMDNYVGVSKGIAIVEYEKDDSVDKVFQDPEHAIDGHKLVVKEYITDMNTPVMANLKTAANRQKQRDQ